MLVYPFDMFLDVCLKHPFGAIFGKYEETKKEGQKEEKSMLVNKK